MKIALVLRDDLLPAHAANAAAVLGLALGGRLPDSVAPDGTDASGTTHAGLNPIPVPTLVASAVQLVDLFTTASSDEALTVVGFNEVARHARTYPAYEEALGRTPTDDIAYIGVIVHGPRDRVTKLTRRLSLFA